MTKIDAAWEEQEDGWPYPDGADDVADPSSEIDEDLMDLHHALGHLLDGLTPLEQAVIAGRYGIGGPELTVKQIRDRTGCTHVQLREALGSGLGKIRARLC